MATLSLDFLRNYRLGTYRESEPVAYQYDQGHVLNILVPGEVTSAEVQYWTQGMTEAAAYEVGSITQQTDGSYVIECNVPNEYFGTWGDLRVYLVVTDDSKYVVTYEGRIKVLQREKPEDYVDDDPDNEALRVLTEAREAAQSASADADRAAQVAASIPADYSELSGNVSNLTQEVSSINERLGDVEDNMGDLSDLDTHDKSSLVVAINEAAQSGGSGGITVVDTIAEMVDTEAVYLYNGTETGYTAGHWYFYNTGTSAWTDGGEYTGWETVETALAEYLQENAQEIGVLSIVIGGTTYRFNGSSDVSITLPIYNGGVS